MILIGGGLLTLAGTLNGEVGKTGKTILNWSGSVSSIPAGGGIGDTNSDVHIPDPENGTAFAVYSETDHSLDFYKRKAVPEVGTTFEGKVVTEVYTGFEADNPATGNSHYEKGYFHDRGDEVRSINVIDKGVSPTQTSGWFSDFSQLETVDIKKLDTSRLQEMTYMFFNCQKLETFDLSNSDFPELTSMGGLFERCYSLKSVNLANCTAPKLILCWYVFYGCALEELDLSSFNAPKVESTQAFVEGNRQLKKIDFGKAFSLKHVKLCRQMFDDCTRLKEIDLGAFDASSLTNSMDDGLLSMFRGCRELKTIRGVENWDVSHVTNANYVFQNCPVLTADLSTWNIASVVTRTGFAENSPGVTEPKWAN